MHMAAAARIGSGGDATYTGAAIMIAAACARVPLGHWRKSAKIAGGRPVGPLEDELGEPGVKHGR
jgi:hypothetical protein